MAIAYKILAKVKTTISTINSLRNVFGSCMSDLLLRNECLIMSTLTDDKSEQALSAKKYFGGHACVITHLRFVP